MAVLAWAPALPSISASNPQGGRGDSSPRLNARIIINTITISITIAIHIITITIISIVISIIVTI
eukprot:8509570-Pyramimonas_sp.AAC.1